MRLVSQVTPSASARRSNHRSATFNIGILPRGGFSSNFLFDPTQNFGSLDLAHCAMKPPSTGIGRPVTYDA